jgi:hypothetical protein
MCLIWTVLPYSKQGIIFRLVCKYGINGTDNENVLTLMNVCI